MLINPRRAFFHALDRTENEPAFAGWLKIALFLMKPEVRLDIRTNSLNIEALLIDSGLTYTKEDVMHIKGGHFAYWFMKNECLQAINQHRITDTQLINIKDGDLKYFLSNPESIAAIQDGIITEEEVKNIHDDNVVYQLLTPRCLAAIRDKRTTVDQIVSMDLKDLCEANINGNYPSTPSSELTI